jgi:hypothetical protein
VILPSPTSLALMSLKIGIINGTTLQTHNYNLFVAFCLIGSLIVRMNVSNMCHNINSRPYVPCKLARAVQSLYVTVRNSMFNVKKFYILPIVCIYMFCVSEQTATSGLYNIN